MSFLANLGRGLLRPTASRLFSQYAAPRQGLMVVAHKPSAAPSTRTFCARAFAQSCGPRSALCGPRPALGGARTGMLSARTPLCARSPRLLSTEAGQSSGARVVGLSRQAYMWAAQNKTVLGVLCGATLVMYGFYRFSMRVMKFFFNVSDKQILEGGFVIGAVSALLIIASGVYASRLLTFHVDDVYRAALRELRKHEQVEKALGGVWHPGAFRGYAIESMSDALAGSERRARSSFFEAPSRRIQMIFIVKGIDTDGLVSLEAHKRGGSYIFEMLSIDIRGTDEHYFILGDDDHPLFPEVRYGGRAERAAGLGLAAGLGAGGKVGADGKSGRMAAGLGREGGAWVRAYGRKAVGFVGTDGCCSSTYRASPAGRACVPQRLPPAAHQTRTHPPTPPTRPPLECAGG
jgi:hypothetical protein